VTQGKRWLWPDQADITGGSGSELTLTRANEDAFAHFGEDARARNSHPSLAQLTLGVLEKLGVS
jgi:hypothetical protein